MCAGGLTIDKFIELKTVISKESPDAIGIAESGSSADNLRFFHSRTINHTLGRSRQIASGIVIFVKNDLTAEPLLKHAMTSSDSLETIELRTLKEEKDLARDRADSSGLLEDCISLRKKQAILKKEILNAKRASFNRFLENFDYRKDGPKAFRFISALNGKQPMKVGGKILTSDLDIAKIFLKYYRKKWDRLFSAPFSDEEFQRALQKLSRGKSAGPDSIPPEFILELGSKAKQTILLFINKTWGGSFPSYWGKADVLPILKPQKDPTDIQSF
ncbi:putative RNA-directed DNA polymerase from transposon BS [Trichonephila clavipes]|nr:putative RNA-directed DNA polymerase from transposon BS [Trichonephila clavipes]